MTQSQLIDEIEATLLKKDIPAFKVGDTISVHYRIIEGEKERIQVFTGTVIARKGSGVSETVSIYRTAYGSAMERVLLVHSPRVAKIEVVKRGKVRRGKLYYLRGIFGKKAKIQERIVRQEKEVPQEEAPAAAKQQETPVAKAKEEAPAPAVKEEAVKKKAAPKKTAKKEKKEDSPAEE